MHRKTVVWPAFVFTLILTACSSTTIVEQWADPDQKTAFNHLLILSLNHSDRKRRVFESGFIAELDKRNIKTTASYELLPDKEDLSKETIKAAIAGTDIDAALVMPGYVTEDTIVHLETNVYRVEGEKLVWSGKTETFNPKNTNTLISELAKTILNELAKSNLI
ncbi:MAG: hypothetical protein ACTSSQ_08500 [Alphaproteobacteria bacterium]